MYRVVKSSEKCESLDYLTFCDVFLRENALINLLTWLEIPTMNWLDYHSSSNFFGACIGSPVYNRLLRRHESEGREEGPPAEALVK